jgi:hypothetical protein
MTLVVVMVALFWFTHSGARASGVCDNTGLAAVSDQSFPSLWPPGARCIGGTEELDIVRFDPSFLILAPTILIVLLAVEPAARVLRPRPSSTGASKLSSPDRRSVN